MSQASVVVANSGGAAFRTAMNNALMALQTNSSGASAPATTYPYMQWFDTTNNVLLLRNSLNTLWRGLLPPGIGPIPYAGAAAPSGYLLFGSDYGRVAYAELFAVVGTKFGAGDGSTTFGLHMEGKTVIGVGAGTSVDAGANADVDTTADTLLVPSNSTKWNTGMPVVFTLTSGTITGLSSGVTYYVIRISSTLVNLASSLANAQNNVKIDFTAKSSPVWSITYTGPTRLLGETGGEDTHAMSSTELLAHTHTLNNNAVNIAGSGSLQNGANWAISPTVGSTGGNDDANIMQPFMALNYLITF